ncbi:hypothetical protein GYMLUDRAFT_52430 [Collybiopsis luxurians FD-317 M1]|nr:hypothetical protein GYMLUDRAFT_52430 [Collybiopsis luxurians FD-317 M1]
MSSYSDKSQILVSATHALDQTPPPSLREILTAYRSKGDGDRDLLLAMLNAKSAEDRRIAETSALHRTIIETFNHDQSSPNLPPLVYPVPSQSHNRLPTLSTSFPYPSGDSYSRKRRPSRSPPHHTYSPYSRPLSRDSATSPIQMPPSPYSSASTSEPNFSPKSKERGFLPMSSVLGAESKRTSSSNSETEDEARRGRS